jgi:DNA-binding XRE family transcriptional regulator
VPNDPKKLNSVADHIKKARLEAGLFQRQLAQKLGVNTDTVILWGTGQTTNISASNYFKKQMSEILGVCF